MLRSLLRSSSLRSSSLFNAVNSPKNSIDKKPWGVFVDVKTLLCSNERNDEAIRDSWSVKSKISAIRDDSYLSPEERNKLIEDTWDSHEEQHPHIKFVQKISKKGHAVTVKELKTMAEKISGLNEVVLGGSSTADYIKHVLSEGGKVVIIQNNFGWHEKSLFSIENLGTFLLQAHGLTSEAIEKIRIFDNSHSNNGWLTSSPKKPIVAAQNELNIATENMFYLTYGLSRCGVMTPLDTYQDFPEGSEKLKDFINRNTAEPLSPYSYDFPSISSDF
jgi:hypothetical protein